MRFTGNCLNESYFTHRRTKGYLTVALWLLFLASAFSPVDLSLRICPGRPHFARLVMGYPPRGPNRDKNREETDCGNTVYTGDVITEHEPKY
jgi:hypothetical protein